MPSKVEPQDVKIDTQVIPFDAPAKRRRGEANAITCDSMIPRQAPKTILTLWNSKVTGKSLASWL